MYLTKYFKISQIIRIYPMSLFDCMNVNLRYEIIIQKECNQKDKLLNFSLHVESQEFLAGNRGVNSFTLEGCFTSRMCSIVVV